MKSKYAIENIDQRYNSLYSDYKAEALAVNIIKYYAEVDQVFLKRLGASERTYRKDIAAVDHQLQGLGESVVSISTYRESIYDYLPEGLFHPASLGIHRTQNPDVIEQMRLQRKIEVNARKYFQPFENEAFYSQVQALMLENEMELNDNSGQLLDKVSTLWPLLQALPVHIARTFTYLLPFFHATRANKNWITKCLSALLQIPVNINFASAHIDDNMCVEEDMALGQINLGVNTLLRGPHMDGERKWVISYGPIPYEKMREYIPGAATRKLLETLYDYCLPAFAIVEERFVVNKEAQSFHINPSENTALLGYTTYL